MYCSGSLPKMTKYRKCFIGIICLGLLTVSNSAHADPEGIGPIDKFDRHTGIPIKPKPVEEPQQVKDEKALDTNTDAQQKVIIVPTGNNQGPQITPVPQPANELIITKQCTETEPCPDLPKIVKISDGNTDIPVVTNADASTDGKAPVATKKTEPEKSEGKDEDSKGICSEEHFYKGELGSFTGRDLEIPQNSFFMGIGYYNVGGFVSGSHYLALKPRLDLHFDISERKKLDVSLEGPINLTLWDKYDKKDALGRIRKEDYDEWRDFLKLIRRIRLGRKEDKIYINFGPLYGVSIGHGTVMRRYTPNINPDKIKVGMQLDGYMDYGGFESVVSDLGFDSQVVGILGFIKPFSFLSKHYFPRSISFGVHYTADLKAPEQLHTDQYGTYVVDDADNLAFDATKIGFWGIDFEMKPIRLCNLLDVKFYADYSQTTVADKGRGITGGLLIRSNIGFKPLLSAVRVRLEYRAFDNNYIPNYFDSMYEIQKYQFIRGKSFGNEPTKYTSVLAQDKQGSFENGSFYSELSYSLVDYISVGAGLEKMTSGADDYNLIMHLEVPALDFLRFFVTYQKTMFSDFDDVFAFIKSAAGQKANSDDEIFYAQAKLKILPFMYINALIMQTYEWDSRVGAGIGGFKAKLDYRIDTEIGFSF